MKRIINFINKHKEFLSIVILLGGLLFLPSCLKDKREDLSKSAPLVGFLFPNTGFYPAAGGFTSSLPLTFSSTPQMLMYDSTQAYPSGNDVPLEIELSYTSFPAPYSGGPVTATVAVDTTEISVINAAAGSNFIMLPAGSFTLPNNGQVTIQPVQLGKYPIAMVTPMITTSMLDTTQTYILPLKITSVSQGITVASNLDQGAIAVIIK